MALRRVRRDGNSLVVAIPADEAVKAHLAEGDLVEVHTDEQKGTIEIVPVEVRRRSDFVELGRQIIKDDRDLLDQLAQYDREAKSHDGRHG